MSESKVLLSKNNVAAPASTIAIGPGAGGTVHNHQDQVTINVIRENNQVQFIEVQCGCGSISRIECEYE